MQTKVTVLMIRDRTMCCCQDTGMMWILRCSKMQMRLLMCSIQVFRKLVHAVFVMRLSVLPASLIVTNRIT